MARSARRRQQKKWTEDAIVAAVRTAIATQQSIDPSDVRRDRDFYNDLSVDSLGSVQIMMDIEDAFGIDIPDEDAARIRTVDDLVLYLLARVSGDAAINPIVEREVQKGVGALGCPHDGDFMRRSAIG